MLIFICLFFVGWPGWVELEVLVLALTARTFLMKKSSLNFNTQILVFDTKRNKNFNAYIAQQTLDIKSMY